LGDVVSSHVDNTFPDYLVSLCTQLCYSVEAIFDEAGEVLEQ
jgi:hypothetical protein